MSNDLISRSALISRIESERRQWGEDYDAEQILGDIEDMPVAYEPDKVVEQLEEAKTKDTETALDEAQKERCFWYAQGMNRAIEIVKGGGVNAQTNTKISKKTGICEI